MSGLTRRSLLVGAGAVVAAAGAGLVLAAEDDSSPPPRVNRGVELVSGRFTSAARGRQVGWSLARPRGAGAALPLVVVLHGRSGDHRGAFGSLRFDDALDALVSTGGRPVAVASVDGGNHTYYHRRADGDDPARMIVEELIPLLRREFGLSDRLGLAGWSMGGYGALLLASTYGADRFPAVAASSAALWHRWRDSAPGAFDGPADFAAHDVLGAAPTTLSKTAVRIVCGRSDPFIATDRALARALPQAEALFPAGGHDSSFWRSTNLDQLRFLAQHLEG